MKKKLLSAILSLLIVSGTISGYGNTTTKLSTATNVSEAVATTDFNESLITFIEKNGFGDKNFMISPTSFRAAMALAISGADKETKNELLKAMGFNDTNELNAWYNNVKASVNSFNNWLQDTKKNRVGLSQSDKDVESPDGAFDLQNSIWHNTSSRGTLSEKYIKYVEDNYSAKAENVSKDKITNRVNGWINENTHGLIPSISDDLSYTDLVLVNTLYLRTAWANEFMEHATEEGEFKTLSGKTVKKDFMRQKDRFRYYEDEKGKFVVLPMMGGINAVFILGDIDNVIGKLAKSSFEEVSVKLPKFESETSFNDNQLINFCKERGAEQAFTANADFSIMSEDASLFISDIIQKTKIKLDEKGIEAAAATAVMMKLTSMIEMKESKEFIADKPFKYMILTDTDSPELLFYGQLVE